MKFQLYLFLSYAADRTPPIPDGVSASSDILGLAVSFSGSGSRGNRRGGSSLSGVQIIAVSGYGKAFKINYDGSVPQISSLFSYHYGPVWGAAIYEDDDNTFLFTCGDDSQLYQWDVRSSSVVNRTKLLASGRCLDVQNKLGKYLAVGMVGGIISIYLLQESKHRTRHLVR